MWQFENETAPIMATSKYLRKNPRTGQFLIQGGTNFCKFLAPEGKTLAGVTSTPEILNEMRGRVKPYFEDIFTRNINLKF